MSVTRELVRTVRKRVAETPGLPTSQLAEELNAAEADVIMAMPLSMRLRAKTSDLDAIWQGMLAWDTTIVCENKELEALLDDLEQKESAPLVSCRKALPNDIGSVWFVLESSGESDENHAVRIFDMDGKALLSVYLRKDASGKVDADSKNAFDNMRFRFGVRPQPRMRCKGCGACTCGTKGH